MALVVTNQGAAPVAGQQPAWLYTLKKALGSPAVFQTGPFCALWHMP